MSGWIAIPHAALSAVGREGRLAVLDLWERADRCGYTWIRWTERGLAEDWGVDRRVVRDVIGALQDAGLVDVERAAPGSGQSSRLRVHSAVNQERNQERNQNDRARSPSSASPEPETEPAAEPRAYRAPARSDQDQTRPETTADLADAGVREPETETETEAMRLERAVAELVSLQEQDEPEHGMSQPRDSSAVRRALRSVTLDDLRALWAWSGTADDPVVAGCRTGGWRRWGSLLRPGLGEQRIAAARAWDAAGRPAPALPAARPGRPARVKPAPLWTLSAVPADPAEQRRALVAALLEDRTDLPICNDEGDAVRAWGEALELAPPELAAQLRRRRFCPREHADPEALLRSDREVVEMFVGLYGADGAREQLAYMGAGRVEQLIAELRGAA